LYRSDPTDPSKGNFRNKEQKGLGAPGPLSFDGSTLLGTIAAVRTYVLNRYSRIPVAQPQEHEGLFRVNPFHVVQPQEHEYRIPLG